MPSQPGSSSWQTLMSSQPGSSNWQRQMPAHSATPYWQPTIPSHLGTYNWQSSFPSYMGNLNLKPPIGRHQDARSNLSPLNLGNALDDDNKGGDDVMFLGGQFTSNYLVYENVNISKVRRDNYVNYMDFLNNPDHIYLDCYIKGYLVPVTFWQQLVPYLCMPDIDSNTLVGWLSREMNSWMELLIRNRPKMPRGQWPIRIQ
ncbi:hypothetical protein Tco_1263610 [Tanacetum coccineum]